jgi:hypothetical protein
MILSIIAFIVIVGIAIMVKTGWRPSRPNVPSINLMGIVTKLAVAVLLLSMGSCALSCSYMIFKKATEPSKGSTNTNQEAVQQLPDEFTPCKFYIKGIKDLYTDAEPIYALPPDWPREKAIYYSGKGHVVVKDGGNTIKEGYWEFWSAQDPKKKVLIRIIGK